MDKIKEILNPSVRRWLYGVVIAVIPILTALGVITDEMAPLIVALVGALLAVGVADFHVPEATDYEEYKARHAAQPEE